MDSLAQEDTPLPSPTSATTQSTSISIHPSSYLSVPGTRSFSSTVYLPRSKPSEENSIVFPLITPLDSRISFEYQHSRPNLSLEDSTQYLILPPISIDSTDSFDSETSTFNNPPARAYDIPSFKNMSNRITPAEKNRMIQALNSHHVNTLTELRRIEKDLASLGSSDVAAPMTAAWSYYVNSHGLLTELRSLTKNYPFSSECVEEAKRRVYADPESNRSWNFCWLVLNKIRKDQLIPYYAQYQASQPTMWGGQSPSSEGINQLTNAFVAEWNWAIGQMLRHWDQPPSR